MKTGEEATAVSPSSGFLKTQENTSSNLCKGILSQRTGSGDNKKGANEKEAAEDEEKMPLRRKKSEGATTGGRDGVMMRRRGFISMVGNDDVTATAFENAKKRFSGIEGGPGVSWYQAMGETPLASVRSPYPSNISMSNASQGTLVSPRPCTCTQNSSSASTLGGGTEDTAQRTPGGTMRQATSDLSPPTMSEVEGYGLDESIVMSPARFAILKANLDEFMNERQRELTGGVTTGSGIGGVGGTVAGVGGALASPVVGVVSSSRDCTKACWGKSNNAGMSFGNFGFGSSVRMSGDDTQHMNKIQGPLLYRVMRKVGLEFIYDKRNQIKITIFSLLAILASFLYMSPGKQITEKTFLSLTEDSPSTRVDLFPPNSGLIYHEVSFTVTGMLKDSSFDVTNASTPHIRVRLCNKTSSVTSLTSSFVMTSLRQRDCLAETNLTIMDNTYSQSAQVVKWSQTLKRHECTLLHVDLVSFPAFSFMMDFSLSGDASRMEVVVAAVILLLFYFLVITEVFHRTVAAMLSSTVALAALSVMGKGPRINDVMRWIEWETLMLMFGMMILVAIFAESGFFDRMSLSAFRLARGRLWPLIYILCSLTGIMSAILDNVTTILLMAPVSLNLCEVLNVDPKWVLIAQVIISNIGGTATAIGDLPNVLIVSNENLQSQGVDFGTFTMHVFLGSLVAAFFAMVTLQYLYRNKNFGSVEDAEIRAWETELRMWRQTMARVGSISREEKAVRGMLMVHMGNLWASMNNNRHFRRRQFYPNPHPLNNNISRDHTKHEQEEHSPHWDVREPEPEPPLWMSKYEELKVTYVIRDHSLLAKSGILIFAVVLMFLLQSTHLFPNTELGLIAILGSIVLLLLTDIDDIEDILHKVEWATLIFFAAEFVLMQALREMRMLETVVAIAGDTLGSVVPPSVQFPVALLLMLWLSALMSSLIDNIPLTKSMIPLLVNLCDANPNLHLKPMVYALAFGACFGGNGSLIGASSNVVCAGIAENKGTKICFGEFFCIGFPIMIVTTSVAMMYLTFCHLFYQWDNL